MADATERTFIMVKPDGVQRGLVGEIIRRFEQRGYKLVALKLLTVKLKNLILYLKKEIFYYRLPELYLKITMKNIKVREKNKSFFFSL
jgi:nucleoside diphosphate kinase